MSLKDRFIWLSKILYPDGRAFRAPAPIGTPNIYVTEDESDDYVTEDGSAPYITEDSVQNTSGIHYRLLRAIAATQAQTWEDLTQILWDILPDSDKFTQDDANDWYRRLGLYNSGSVSLSDMKLAIAQAQSFPFTPLNRRTADFMTEQLQAAGFNVKVYKNYFLPGPVTKTPTEILGEPVQDSYLGGFYLGDAELGSANYLDNITILANYLEEDKDAGFVISNYRFTFYVADPSSITTFATIPAARNWEFRQMLLKLKSAHSAGILFVNYV